MRTNAALFFALAFAPVLSAQPTSQVDSWHGLNLDVSTRDDVERVLGKATKEGGARLFLDYASRYFRPGIATTLPSLTYKKAQGFAKVDLFFNDGVLVAIALTPAGKTIDAAGLPSIYGIPFEKLNTKVESVLGSGPRMPGGMPLQYMLGAFADRAILLAEIASPRFINNKNSGEFPGTVMRLTMISRRLGAPEKGSGLLK